MKKKGFTLVEILLVCFIIGVLAGLLFAPISRALRYRKTAQVADKIRTAVQAFELYELENGAWPADKNPGQIPPEMQGYYFPYYGICSTNGTGWWTQTTELGGNWDWDELAYSFHGWHDGIIAVSISGPTATSNQLTELDKMIDDGNLNTGSFIKWGGAYHFIIADKR